MFLETIYSTGDTHDNHHDDSNIFIAQATVCHKTLRQKNGRSQSQGLDLSRPLLRDRMIHHIRLIFWKSSSVILEPLKSSPRFRAMWWFCCLSQLVIYDGNQGPSLQNSNFAYAFLRMYRQSNWRRYWHKVSVNLVFKLGFYFLGVGLTWFHASTTAWGLHAGWPWPPSHSASSSSSGSASSSPTTPLNRGSGWRRWGLC